MAQTGYTPISLYYSTTASAAPTAGNLVAGELAINTVDEKLYFKNSAGTVKLLASSAGSLGDVVGPASATDKAIATFDGTTGKLIQNNSGVTITSGVITATGFSGPLNGTVGATTPNTGAFTTLSSTGNTTLGDATTDTVTVNGYMGVGITPSPNVGVFTRPSALTTSTQIGVLGGVLANASATDLVAGVYGEVRTAAAAFAATNGAALYANNSFKGSGSTITNQHGVYIADQTQGTNNYGITSLVSSGTNKWNIYASGTAANYFAGNVGIGTSSPGAKLSVDGSAIFNDSGADVDFRVESDTNTHALFVDAGNSRVGINNSSPTNALSVTGAMDVSGNVTLGDASGDSLTINAGTWTIGANYTATRAAGAVAATTQNILTNAITMSGEATGVAIVRSNRENVTFSSTNPIAEINTHFTNLSHSGSGAIASAEGVSFYFDSTGGATDSLVNAFVVRAPFFSGGSTVTTYNGYRVLNQSSSAITTFQGVMVEAQTGATNIRGIRSAIASAANRYNLYIDGTAQNYLLGDTGIGSLPQTGTSLYINRTATETAAGERALWSSIVANNTSGSNTKAAIYAVTNLGAAQSGSNIVPGIWAQNQTSNAGTFTAQPTGFLYDLSMVAAANLSAAKALQINTVTNTGGGTLATFTGIDILAQTVGTNIYGIRSQIASAANRWNLYIDGTADNYFAGNVGIGYATAPDAPLTLDVASGSGASNTSYDAISLSSGNSTYPAKIKVEQGASSTVHSLSFWTSNAATPTEKFKLNPTEAVFNDPGNDYDFRVESDTNTHALFVQGSDGNVGIGTSSIGNSAKLHATGSIISTAATLGTFNSDNSGFDFVSASKIGRFFATSTNTTGGVMTFTTGQNGTYSERIRIDASGNVGIGTSSPTAKLQIGDSTVATSNRLVFGKAQAASEGNLPAIGQQSSGLGNDLAIAATSTSGVIRLFTGSSANSGEIGTGSNTERMRIDSSGTAFIRTGTSTTNTNSSKLVVDGTISETVSSTQYLVASQYDIGTAPNEIPINGYLGSMAYQDTAPVAAPASASAAGLPGQIAYDSSYFYVCTAVNTWKRVAIATW